jgi:cytochrome c peroxidase
MSLCRQYYNPGQGGLVGGNFWNMRKQVAVWVTRPRIRRRPPTNPVEMALPDAVCAVDRASKRPHRGLFELVWGAQSFVIIKWSADVEAVCDTPGPPPDSGPPVWLDPTDRGRANASFDQMAQSIPDYEVSAEVTPLTSKRDAVQAGKAQFTRQEQLGYDLFRGKAKCNACS